MNLHLVSAFGKIFRNGHDVVHVKVSSSVLATIDDGLIVDVLHHFLVFIIDRDAALEFGLELLAFAAISRYRFGVVVFQLAIDDCLLTGFKRSIRELCKLQAFDYVPAFRGRAIHFRQRDVPFKDLEIDFDELKRRKDSEFEKLDHVIRFAQTANCRQLAVLNYFGDPEADRCGNCDRCGPARFNADGSARSTSMELDEQHQIVHEALAELPEEYRDVFQ